MKTPRTIKKYPNRRLYDTQLSRYITLEDVRRLVLAGEGFKVIDTQTEEDITRSILLQIIIEQESHGQPLFSNEVLAQMIRFYGGSYQEMFVGYLHDSLELFMRHHQQLRQQVTEVFGKTPIDAMMEMGQRNLELWRHIQEGLLNAAYGRYGEPQNEPIGNNPPKDISTPSNHDHP